MNASAIRLLDSAARQMIARPFASETVAARAVCRLKCSVVAKLTAAARRSPNTWASGTGMGPPDPVESGESFVGRVWSKHVTDSEDPCCRFELKNAKR